MGVRQRQTVAPAELPSDSALVSFLEQLADEEPALPVARGAERETRGREWSWPTWGSLWLLVTETRRRQPNVFVSLLVAAAFGLFLGAVFLARHEQTRKSTVSGELRRNRPGVALKEAAHSASNESKKQRGPREASRLDGNRVGPIEFLSSPEILSLAVNGSATDGSPSLSADQSTLLFASTRSAGAGGFDIWMCRRVSPKGSWEEAVNLGPTVNSSDDDSGPTLSADGLLLLFDSARPGGQGGRDLWMCERSSVTQSWGRPVNLGANVNSPYDDAEPSLSGDGLTLVFQSLRPGGQGSWDLWMCRRKSRRAPWGSAVNLGPVINSSQYEAGPCLSADGLLLVFGSQGRGGDLWVSARTSVNSPWNEPLNLGSFVNTPHEEWSPALSFDGQTLLFESRRPSGYGGFDLYQVPIRLHSPGRERLGFGRNSSASRGGADGETSAR